MKISSSLFAFISIFDLINIISVQILHSFIPKCTAFGVYGVCGAGARMGLGEHFCLLLNKLSHDILFTDKTPTFFNCTHVEQGNSNSNIKSSAITTIFKSPNINTYSKDFIYISLPSQQLFHIQKEQNYTWSLDCDFFSSLQIDTNHDAVGSI